MLQENITQVLDMYALGAIGPEDVEYLLGRSVETLTEEELTYIGCLQKDYDAWLIEQQLLEEESINPEIINDESIN